jgi:KipI family sensor histidine kinase inhibitor
MGESALLVSLGTGVSPALNGRVHALAGRLRLLALPGVLDIVPAFASVLVTFDDTRIDEETLAAHIERLSAGHLPGESTPARRHDIPVVYGGEHGPDLERLAASHGLSADEVVRRHAAPVYRVYFLGFMPGFAYLGGLDPSIASPRLGSPRVRVPAGSVGIAGDQTGIYPLASPGGWQLIGRTNVPLWDIDRDPPALLAPSDEVRFVRTGELSFGPGTARREKEPHEPGTTPVFAVEEPGALTLVQDLGRPGFAHFGLSVGGAMDPYTLAGANQLVGNGAGDACLEITWSGPVLRALATTVIAVAGGELGCKVDGSPVPNGVSWLVRAGATLRFTRTSHGNTDARCYLAVAGGFSAVPALGSRSTYLPGSFGGYGGRPLQSRDTLHARPHLKSPAELAGRMRPISESPPRGVAVLRYVPFEGDSSVPLHVRGRAERQEYEVSPASDRMGVRLVPEDALVLQGGGGELASFGVVRGAIQLPPGGTPLVLGADHQTTGGYPLLGVVARADWPALAQLKPGRRVRLQPVTVAEARAARHSGSTASERGE